MSEEFGKYIEDLRTSRGESLRKTAEAVGVSPQFYSEVEKGRSNAFRTDRLKRLVTYFALTEKESNMLYDIAAKSRTSNDVVVPQDCVDYMVDNSYVIEAVRLSKETGAGEKEWRMLLEALKLRKA